MGPAGGFGGVGGGQTLNFMRSNFGVGQNQGEHLSLPSVAGATFTKLGSSNTIGSHLLGQENHSDNFRGQGIVNYILVTYKIHSDLLLLSRR